LANACADVARSPKGDRNNTLNAAAFSLGQLIGAKLLDRTTVENALLSVATGAKIEGARATIKSGITSGIANPRELAKLNNSTRAAPNTNPAKPRQAAEKKTSEYARDLYDNSVDARGTLAERYLREHRQLRGEMPRNARFHPEVRHKSGRRLPALVVPILPVDEPNAGVKSVHVTYLEPATGAKANVDPAKQMFGPARGGAIRIGESGNHMLCCEGIEKGMACQAATGLSVAVGLSSTILPHIIWPRGTAKITICADANAAGENAINKAAAKWIANGKAVHVCYPPVPGRDWDEVNPADALNAINAAIAWQPPQAKTSDIFKTANAADFERDTNGRILKNEWNILYAIDCTGVKLTHNTFSGDYYVSGLEGYGPHFDSDAADELYLVLQREYNFKPSWDDFRRVTKSAARRKAFHPVRDYLAGLQWDGIERVGEWLSTYAGAADTPYIQAIGRIMLIAAVRRVRQPGCKFDEVVVLESPEGKGKSTAIKILAGEQWFSDNAPFAGEARETIEQLRGHWLIEYADLAGVRKADVEHLKAFLSRAVDHARLAYDREITRFPRQCIFIGTTNEEHYLLSATGNRRFWPIPIKNFDLENLARDRDQLWAEAAYWEAQGESIRLPKELWKIAAAEQKAREEFDAWDEVVADWLEAELRDSRNLMGDQYQTRIIDVAKGAIGIETSRLDGRTEKRIARAMKRAGWTRGKRSHGQRYWKLATPAQSV
jgi:hypothetical protein